jgi:hypothetical protein
MPGQQEAQGSASEAQGSADIGARTASAVDAQAFWHDRFQSCFSLNEKLHETSGWIPLRQWQKCGNCMTERVCSLIPGSSNAGGTGAGAQLLE